MNLTDLENHLKLGLVPAEPSTSITAQIDQKLLVARRHRSRRRGFSLAFAATACAATVLLGLPTIAAHAALQRLAGALDNVRSVILTQEAIAPDGSRHYTGRIAYFDGKWRIESPNGGLTYFLNGTRYRLDQTHHQFVTEDGLAGPFSHNPTIMSLASVLGDIQKWDPRVHIEIDQAEFRGKQVTRAIISEAKSEDRSVLFADRETDLPIEIDSETGTSGHWTSTEAQTFDYNSKQTSAEFIPDIKRFPSISKKQHDSEMVRDLTENNLGSVPLNKGRLVVRAMDVASDGTVFVTCQAGERVPMWDRGYAIDISDSLGTKYALMKVDSVVDKEFIGNSNDGKLELCVFVPASPSSEWRARDVAVTARLQADRQLERHLIGFWGNRKAQFTSTMWYYDKSIPVSVVTAAHRHVDRPTVDHVPGYASIIDPNRYGESSNFEAQKAKARADYYRGQDNVGEEERWLNESLRLREGTGGSMEASLRLEELRSKKRP